MSDCRLDALDGVTRRKRGPIRLGQLRGGQSGHPPPVTRVLELLGGEGEGVGGRGSGPAEGFWEGEKAHRNAERGVLECFGQFF